MFCIIKEQPHLPVTVRKEHLLQGDHVRVLQFSQKLNARGREGSLSCSQAGGNDAFSSEIFENLDNPDKQNKRKKIPLLQDKLCPILVHILPNPFSTCMCVFSKWDHFK